MKVTLNEFLTEEQIQICVELYTKLKQTGQFAKTICDKIIIPNIAEINAKIGQENDPKYLAYMVEYVLSKALDDEVDDEVDDDDDDDV